MRKRETGSFQDILIAIAVDAFDLARKEIDLFRAETGETVRGLFFIVILTVTGLTVAVAAIAFLGVALFEWMIIVLDSRILAALSVAGIAAVIAVCIIGAAYSRLVRTSFVPRQTLASLRQDTRAFFGEARDE